MVNDEVPWINHNIDFAFPCPGEARNDIVAMGGNLSPGMLLSAYRRGIFPWYSQGEPIFWWSLDPRFVLYPQDIHISRSLKKSIKKSIKKANYRFTLDQDFSGVIFHCQTVSRKGQEGETWITEDMVEAYTRIFSLGYGHSVEVWRENKLVGGLYGVSLGGCFFGESMFSHEANASKMALAALAGVLRERDFGLIDCQQHTPHLDSLGAVDIPRNEFLLLLEKEVKKPVQRGLWSQWIPDFPASELWKEILE